MYQLYLKIYHNFSRFSETILTQH